MTDPIPPTIEWRADHVRLIDQRRLPGELVFLEAHTVEELCDAIRTLAVRGAPALGVAGAMGIALAAATGVALEEAGAALVACRPTAVNLAWGAQQALGADLLPAGARVLTHCNAGALACAGYGTALGVIRAAHEAGLQLAPEGFTVENRAFDVTPAALITAIVTEDGVIRRPFRFEGV